MPTFNAVPVFDNPSYRKWHELLSRRIIRRRAGFVVLRIQRELKPDTEIAREAQKIRRKAFFLSRDIALFDSEIERDSIDSWKTDEAPKFALILFEKLDRVCDLRLELGEICFTCDGVET